MAAYQYEFDTTKVGDVRYDKDDFKMLQDALKLLEGLVCGWNKVAIDYGALEAPYKREADDLQGMIEWGNDRLSQDARIIRINGISRGNIRYLKAALIHAAWHEEERIKKTAGSAWPSAVVEAIRGKVKLYRELAEDFGEPPAAILDQIRPEYGTFKTESSVEVSWDAFVSHASEDKSSFVRALVDALQARDLTIWYDEFSLKIGDSLRRSIDRGLARSRYGVVVLSQNFFAKEWPQKELDGLLAREADGKKVILPVWHGIDAEGIRRYSPMLADRVAISSEKGVEAVVEELVRAMTK